MTDPVALPAGAATVAITVPLTFAQVFSCATGIPLELFVWGDRRYQIAIIYDEPPASVTGNALLRHAWWAALRCVDLRRYLPTWWLICAGDRHRHLAARRVGATLAGLALPSFQT